MLRGMSVAGYLKLNNFSCNLCHIKTARQIVGKIAQCNIGLSCFGLCH